jgi:hypothetical protein
VVCLEGEERETRTCGIRSWRAEYTSKRKGDLEIANNRADGHTNRADGKRAAATDDVTAAAEVRFGAERSIAERPIAKAPSNHELINRGCRATPWAGKKKRKKKNWQRSIRRKAEEQEHDSIYFWGLNRLAEKYSAALT